MVNMIKKRNFFQVVVVSILQYRCTTWTLTKCIGKKLDGNCTRMLRVIMNKPWMQSLTKQHLYGHLPPISKTIQIGRARHAGHWRIKDELINGVLLWTPLHVRVKGSIGWPTRTYLQQPCTDSGCNLENLPEAMKYRDDDDDLYTHTHIYIYIYIVSWEIMMWKSTFWIFFVLTF